MNLFIDILNILMFIIGFGMIGAGLYLLFKPRDGYRSLFGE